MPFKTGGGGDITICHTNGSCLVNPGTCGVGSCILFPGSCSPVSKHGSILLGELVAIQMTINLIQNCINNKSDVYNLKSTFSWTVILLLGS